MSSYFVKRIHYKDMEEMMTPEGGWIISTLDFYHIITHKAFVPNSWKDI